MKYVKLFIAFIIAIIVTITLLSFFAATSQKIEKSITINAPASVIFEQMAKLENFNKWSVWNSEDSTIQHIVSGTDGTVGAVSNWKGHPEISGEGKMEIIAIEKDKKVAHSIHFLSPGKNKAESVLLLNQTNSNETKLTWKFSMATPRPWNIFNLFYSMDKERGKDFDDSLSLLKKLTEKK